MLIRDCLAKVIQLVSRNTLKVEDFKDCETTCDVLDTFVNKYPANVIFTGKLGDTTVTSSMTVVVKNAKGEIITKGSDYYELPIGKYTYSVSCTGATAITDEEFEITLDDISQPSAKTIDIVFEAAA